MLFSNEIFADLSKIIKKYLDEEFGNKNVSAFSFDALIIGASAASSSIR